MKLEDLSKLNDLTNLVGQRLNSDLIKEILENQNFVLPQRKELEKLDFENTNIRIRKISITNFVTIFFFI